MWSNSNTFVLPVVSIALSFEMQTLVSNHCTQTVWKGDHLRWQCAAHGLAMHFRPLSEGL